MIKKHQHRIKIIGTERIGYATCIICKKHIFIPNELNPMLDRIYEILKIKNKE